MKMGRGLRSTTILGLVAVIWYGAFSSALAVDAEGLSAFIWSKDHSTGADVARSRSDLSFNFYDVGDLSPGSLDSVQDSLTKISKAAGISINRSLTPTIGIFHDTSVFSRLKNDRPSFTAYGVPDDVLDRLSSIATDDSSKCLALTFSDNTKIYWTVILLSQPSNGCLLQALLESFGIRASDLSAETLADVCVLYDARRLGVRDRRGLSEKFPSLRNACLTKLG